MSMQAKVAVAHVKLCDWSRQLTLAILEREAVDVKRYGYTWEDNWFAFAYGLAGDYTDGDPERAEANAHGRRLRALCGPYEQEVLSDLQVATPAHPGDWQDDDLFWLRNNWGIITEAAYDLGVAVPPEVEWLVTEQSLPDALDTPHAGRRC